MMTILICWSMHLISGLRLHASEESDSIGIDDAELASRMIAIAWTWQVAAVNLTVMLCVITLSAGFSTGSYKGRTERP